MTFSSYATREDDKSEEEVPTFTLKPMVLPTITMPLKVVWKANKAKLERHGCSSTFVECRV